MVLSFFRKGPSGLEHAVSRAVGMLGDARHSFDLATLALLTDTSASAVDSDIRATEERMNRTEIELRSELVVHISVQGTMDIGSVLGLILLINRIERIGDQARNVLDLAEAGAVLADQPDSETLLAERSEISALFGEVAALMVEHDDTRFAELTQRCEELQAAHQAKIIGYLHSDEPGHQVVPRAIYYRYLNRIVANLIGIARAGAEQLVFEPGAAASDLDE
jgi:hypothetical protein